MERFLNLFYLAYTCFVIFIGLAKDLYEIVEALFEKDLPQLFWWGYLWLEKILSWIV
ncbi:hypothetical protein [Thalassospira profundimaris]|uniref:hypothetical protein n=1 Tax=Thalassospira profundimaris TaxID=502049 RepID=UPI0015F10A1D|nr:hypothetical protein [Thalassospira profundimaris]